MTELVKKMWRVKKLCLYKDSFVEKRLEVRLRLDSCNGARSLKVQQGRVRLLLVGTTAFETPFT